MLRRVDAHQILGIVRSALTFATGGLFLVSSNAPRRGFSGRKGACLDRIARACSTIARTPVNRERDEHGAGAVPDHGTRTHASGVVVRATRGSNVGWPSGRPGSAMRRHQGSSPVQPLLRTPMINGLQHSTDDSSGSGVPPALLEHMRAPEAVVRPGRPGCSGLKRMDRPRFRVAPGSRARISAAAALSTPFPSRMGGGAERCAAAEPIHPSERTRP